LNSISTETLIISLVILIILSAFFSSSETGMMRLNRYKLKSIINSKDKRRKAAMRVVELLKRPDRLIGVILIGNNFVNIFAATVATLIAERLWGNLGLVLAPIALTIIVLIFAELTPKTLAATHPEKIAFPAAIILKFLLVILYPFVWIVNVISNGILKLFGVNTADADDEKLDQEELRNVVTEAGPMIPRRHQRMLLNILDLETATVEDIMVPRREIVGINLDNDWSEIQRQLHSSQHTRLLVFNGEIDNPVGMLHARDLINLLANNELTKDILEQAISEVYFVPEGTPLHTQLLNFQRKKERIGAVVDEYGDIQGLVTLEDILEEIVGEFTTDHASNHPEILRQQDRSLLIDGSIAIRDLNRTMGWDMPTDGPKTLNGLVTEYLEYLPAVGTGLRLYGYPMEVIEVEDNMLKWVKIYPDLFVQPD
jgi:Mg2+/Co2+ transporter CorB